MRRAIVAFDIDIEQVEAKAKLSQNKSPETVAGVAGALSASGMSDSLELVRLMRAFNAGR